MEKFKQFIIKIFSYKFVRCILISLCVTFICDILTQRSILEAIVRMFTKPLNFMYNMLLIMSTISICSLFKRRKFAIMICSCIWIGVAIVNFVVQSFRNTPFSFVDIILLPSVFSVFNSYINLFEFILILVLIIGVITGLVFLYKKESLKERLIKHSLITCVIAIALLIVVKTPFIKVGAISDDYSNLIDAYEEYGLPYCFVTSVVDLGVDKPEEYNEIVVDEVIQNIQIYNKQLESNIYSEYTVDTATKPNVVFLQLESFIDANNLHNLQYSQNPTKTFEYLKNNYPSGTLTVPSVGAGTANVEFEIMTGFNLNHFGAGDYPYKTVVNKTTVESIAFLLKDEGYYPSAIHNNRASFYDRETVFSYLGYDRFVSSEFMIDLSFTNVGWYKDDVLEYEIMKALKSSEQTDFIYTISVQPHGKYLEDLSTVEDMVIDVTSITDISEERLNQFKYYVNQLYEVDILISNLINEINNYDEPTMLVIYGDHLPSLELENEDLKHNDIYKSEYVIYTNYDLQLEDKDLYSYQLSSHVLQTINCDNGIINQIHQTRDINNINYQEYLKTIMYDIVEGDMLVYNGVNPYIKSNLKLGYDDIIISNVIISNDKTIIKGKNFNLNSTVFINNKKYITKYIDKNTIYIEEEINEKNINVCIKQTYNNIVYSESNVYKIKK